jgi:hypothetical protein
MNLRKNERTGEPDLKVRPLTVCSKEEDVPCVIDQEIGTRLRPDITPGDGV